MSSKVVSEPPAKMPGEENDYPQAAGTEARPELVGKSAGRRPVQPLER